MPFHSAVKAAETSSESEPKYTLQQVFDMCKSRDWDGLKKFQKYPLYSDLYTKILVTALFQAHYKGEEKLDLSYWNDKLSNYPASFITVFFSATPIVDLEEFYLAYKLAGNNFDGKKEGLKDSVVASLIRDYVKAHKKDLCDRPDLAENEMIAFAGLECDAKKENEIPKSLIENNVSETWCALFEKENKKGEALIEEIDKLKGLTEINDKLSQVNVMTSPKHR